MTNSGAAGYAESNLLGQQGATTAAQYAPLISQAFGYDQGDLSQNAANQQAVNLTNAGASNATAATNAGAYNTAVGENATAYNNYLNELYGAGTNEQSALLSAYLNSFGANTGVTNALSQGLAGQQNAYADTYANAVNQQNQIAKEGTEFALASG